MDSKLLVVLVWISLFISACIPIQSIFLGMPDAKDIKRFAKHNIEADSESCFSFEQSTIDYSQSLKVNDWTTDIPFFVTLPEFVESHKIRSFMVIQRDTILYEYYGLPTTSEDLHSSYSIAKCFMSALIGIAIDEQLIESEKDLVLNYIPELEGLQYADQLTVEHLLNHTSGIKYRLDLDATLYYGHNILKSLKKIKFERPPGQKQHYLNVNLQLLGIVLKRATKQSPSEYLEAKIWKPIGMCSGGVWATDRKNELEKTYCCLGATAQDYAKFGRLYLNGGNWEGQQIVSNEWYQKSIRRDTTAGSSYNYNYSWHLGLKEYGDYMAIGLYKQHIYINPKKDLIIVLLNDQERKLKAERVNWWYVFRQIADQL
ncbi:MAG: serine hydrolase [Aureispira sp.]|nr:serine hydrolase [Aureispira sp.]